LSQTNLSLPDEGVDLGFEISGIGRCVLLR
jgi:hypothetical protein